MPNPTETKKICRLLRQHFVPRPLREVFSFFERPENLALITPASLGFQILTSKPIVMQAGAQIDYRIRLIGLPVRWTSLITEYDPPRHFVDEQVRGPYAYWRHIHRFEEVSGGTRLEDEVLYRVGWGTLGELAQRLYVSRNLEKIFDHRARVIEQYFRGGPRLQAEAQKES
ncbi:MAG TPA: SRPBCC family protein [Verrucomicrobiae bacterium]|nr:SRPBCC family protein [Verrucomicrobiae bacterium]